MLRIALVRHGLTRYNAKRRYQGHLDVPLSRKGLRQAGRLAARFAGEAVSRVYSSDLCRAMDTARAIALPHSLEAVPLRELREIDFGEWEGLSPDQVRERWPGLWERWLRDPHGIRIPGGETLEEMGRRVISALGTVAWGHTRGVVVAVTHGGPIMYALAALSGEGGDGLWRYGIAPGQACFVQGTMLTRLKEMVDKPIRTW